MNTSLILFRPLAREVVPKAIEWQLQYEKHIRSHLNPGPQRVADIRLGFLYIICL